MKKFTPEKKRMVLRLFKSGDSMPYLAGLFETSLEKVEQAIRVQLISQEGREMDEEKQDDKPGNLNNI